MINSAQLHKDHENQAMGDSPMVWSSSAVRGSFFFAEIILL